MKKKKKEKPILSPAEQHIAKVDAFIPEAERYARTNFHLEGFARKSDEAEAWSKGFTGEMNRLTIAAGLRIK